MTTEESFSAQTPRGRAGPQEKTAKKNIIENIEKISILYRFRLSSKGFVLLVGGVVLYQSDSTKTKEKHSIVTMLFLFLTLMNLGYLFFIYKIICYINLRTT